MGSSTRCSTQVARTGTGWSVRAHRNEITRKGAFFAHRQAENSLDSRDSLRGTHCLGLPASLRYVLTYARPKAHGNSLPGADCRLPLMRALRWDRAVPVEQSALGLRRSFPTRACGGPRAPGNGFTRAVPMGGPVPFLEESDLQDRQAMYPRPLSRSRTSASSSRSWALASPRPTRCPAASERPCIIEGTS